MDHKHSWNIGYWLLALALLMLLQSVWQEARHVELVSYSEFEQALSSGRVDRVTVLDNSLVGHLKSPEGSKTTLTTVRVEPDLVAVQQEGQGQDG